jgi:hypothetical protein
VREANMNSSCAWPRLSPERATHRWSGGPDALLESSLNGYGAAGGKGMGSGTSWDLICRGPVNRAQRLSSNLILG